MRRLALLWLLAPALFGEKWSIQYFYDEEREQLNLVDLAFPSAQHGVAVGWIQALQKKNKPTALVTSDGGAHWNLAPLEDQPRSVFFLNDSRGWMVAEERIWLTEDGGKTWRKLSDQLKGDSKLRPRTQGGLILRVWFLDEQHGFAVGAQKTVLETRDGGRSWTPRKEAASPTGNPAISAYTRIAFDGPRGLIVGVALPPQPGQQFPAWMDPAAAAQRRQGPTLTLLLQTRDGGATWNAQNAPLFGVVRALRMSGSVGLDVFDFQQTFEVPSEVYRINFNTGSSDRVFRQKDRHVTDLALFPGPRAFLAAVEPPGRLNALPIAGKVKMLTSSDLSDWQEMEVDYRAVATSLVLAGPDADHLWAATDTGMILQLVK